MAGQLVGAQAEAKKASDAASDTASDAEEWPVSAAPSVDLDALLVDFVRTYNGMRQRDAGWYAVMGVTVGGSELAAIMGHNPYSDFFDVVASKLATLEGGSSWTGGGEACWWGTLFEDVVCAYVEADLGGPIRGDDICIQEVEGHRNSPDGYIVARLYRGTGGALHLWTTDMSPEIPTTPRILLLEFKCPMSRKPLGRVPRQYVPQVWSGLAVSPVAHLGLYVDAVFRKCGILDLGDTPDYDTDYHRYDRGAWELPVAWGLIGVYAPLLDAPRRTRLGWRHDEWAAGDPDPDAPDADASQAAWQIHTAYFGLRLKNLASGTREVVDLGDMEARLFNRTLGLIDRKRFPVTRGAACFADGRGAALHTGRLVGEAIEALRLAAPADHWLLGVLPWKLFEVSYVPVARRPGFMAEVAPEIAAVHQTVKEARAAADPAAYLRAKALAATNRRSPPAASHSTAVDEAVIQDLFDSISDGADAVGADAGAG
jgi:hypothetical protein